MTDAPQKSSEYLRNFSSPYSLKQSQIPQMYNNYQSPPPNYNSIIPTPFIFPFNEVYSEKNGSIVHRSINPEFYSTNHFSQFNTHKFQTQDFPLPINNSFLERFINHKSNINFPTRFFSPNPNEQKPPLPFQEHQQNLIEKPEIFICRAPFNPNVLDYKKPSPIYNSQSSQPINLFESPNRPINQNPFNGSIPFYRSPERMSQNPGFIISNNEPCINFRSLQSMNENQMNLTPIPKIMNQQSSPPFIFFHNKLNEQTKENNVFPDFITVFGTYKHYDLASRESKFRKNISKIKTNFNIENNFIDDVSYLNVNFLQQSHYDKIYDVFKNFIFFDRNVLKLKEDLAHKIDFDIKLLFQYFDDNNTGEIVVAEWREGFAKLGISAEESDIYLMINRYSRDGNKKIE